MRGNLTLNVFFEMQETAQLGIVDNIQKNVLEYMKGRKSKTYAEREVAKDLLISINVVHHATSLKSFKKRFEALKYKGEI